MKKTKSEIKAEIKKLYAEIEGLDRKYHFNEDDVDTDAAVLDRISKKIDRLEMLQRLIEKD